MDIVVAHAFNVERPSAVLGRDGIEESFRMMEWNNLIARTVYQHDRRIDHWYDIDIRKLVPR